MNTVPINFIRTFGVTALILFLNACGGEKKAILFEIQTEGNSFQQHQSIDVSIKNKDGKDINKVVYSIDGEELPQKNGKVVLSVPKLGSKTLKARVSYGDMATDVTKGIKVLAAKAPEIYTYEIIEEYPHDIKSYTQGLEFHNDTLYESTGHNGTSWLRKLNFKTGEVYSQVDLDDTYFGEGITVLNGKVYQLTWKSGVGFVYNQKNLEKLDNFQYGESKEGWGLANDGQKIFKSDGTENIWFLNPDTLAENGHIEIVTNKSIFNKANELEYVDGKLYANVYQKESMMIIDATSGAIEGVINFGGLKEKVTQHEKLDVLNGVAYHPKRKTFFVTGKNWDKMFEVKIIKR